MWVDRPDLRDQLCHRVRFFVPQSVRRCLACTYRWLAAWARSSHLTRINSFAWTEQVTQLEARVERSLGEVDCGDYSIRCGHVVAAPRPLR